MHACLLAAQRLGAGQRVVVVLPDSTRNYMSKFLCDEWMVAQELESPSLLTKSSALLGLLSKSEVGCSPCEVSASPDETPAEAHEWWSNKTVAALRLRSPITVTPMTPCEDCEFLMSKHGIDQVPIVTEEAGVVGVVTLGNLSSKILRGVVAAGEPCSKIMFTQFSQVPPSMPLSAFSRLFERDTFCLVVQDTSVMGVCTQADLLKYVMDGSAIRKALQTKRAAAKPEVIPPRVDMDCSQLAWQFMKPLSPRAAVPKRVDTPVPSMQLPEHINEQLHCSQLAWSFMKRSPQPPAMMHHVSPALHSTSGTSSMPQMGLSATPVLSESQEASEQPTRQGSPKVKNIKSASLPLMSKLPEPVEHTVM